MSNNIIRSILEYSAKELIDLAKVDTPSRYKRRQSLGTPKVKSAHVNYNTGSAVITLETHDHVQQLILEDFVQLVADEVLSHLDNRTPRSEIVKLVKIAVKLIITDGDILVDCDCDDYKYRFNWIAKQYGYAARDRIQGHNYSPDRTNPKLRGGLCKHLIRVLSRPTYWNDTAGRLLINDLLKNKEFVSQINDKLLDKKNYSEEKDYDEQGYPKDTSKTKQSNRSSSNDNDNTSVDNPDDTPTNDTDSNEHASNVNIDEDNSNSEVNEDE